MTTVPSRIHVERSGSDALRVELAGDFSLERGLPASAELEQALEDASLRSIGFESSELGRWDSSLVSFVLRVRKQALARDLDFEDSGLPQGVRGLIALATAVPERTDAARSGKRAGVLSRVGESTQRAVAGGHEMLSFVGETTLAFGRLLVGRARFRKSDLAELLRDCGPRALPIVSLISFLVGLILAFVGAVQLRQFGAQIFVANLVGLGMVREMGAMMAAVIMAGRTGAAFAAQLGTMTVNEEIDALKTMGLSPIEFLVLPRVLALGVTMPLLVLYADALGILGGLAVGVGMLDLSLGEYITQTRNALTPLDITLGVIKGSIYGVLVAIAGCLRGIQCGRSASAVGAATTSAVVTSIVLIIIASALSTVVYEVLGL